MIKINSNFLFSVSPLLRNFPILALSCCTYNFFYNLLDYMFRNTNCMLLYVFY